MPIHDLPRKQWLLMLWNYHHGHLPEADHARVKQAIGTDLQARTDAERVLEIINQLRQTGHWDPSPDFPERMVSSLIGKTGSYRLARVAMTVVAVLLVLTILLILMRSCSPQEGTAGSGQPRIQLPASSPDPLELTSEGLVVKSSPPAEAVRSATNTIQLKDPVPGMEQELDDWLRGPASSGLKM